MVRFCRKAEVNTAASLYTHSRAEEAEAWYPSKIKYDGSNLVIGRFFLNTFAWI
jgi:hypothetical protein